MLCCVACSATGTLSRPPQLEERVESPAHPRVEGIRAANPSAPPQVLPRRHPRAERVYSRRMKTQTSRNGTNRNGTGLNESERSIESELVGTNRETAMKTALFQLDTRSIDGIGYLAQQNKKRYHSVEKKHLSSIFGLFCLEVDPRPRPA